MRLLGLALLAALATTSVYASKARLDALGHNGNDGSYFIHDNRNIFLNPAHINHNKDFVAIEWGSEDPATGANTGEGGVYVSHGKMVYGAHFGRESKINSLRTLLSGGTAPNAGDILDLFVGGDAGVEWGAGLYLGLRDGISTDEDYKDTSAGVRFGIISGDLEVFGTLSAINTVEDNTGDLFQGKVGLLVGASYGFGDYRVFGSITKADGEINGGGTGLESDYTALKLGLGHTWALNEKASLFSSVGLEYMDRDILGAEVKSWYLPLNIGLEVDVKDWLTLRGSVGQYFHINEVDNSVIKYAQSNSTTVAAGASVKFGDFSVDGTFSNAAASQLGFDGGNFLSEVSFNYSF